MTETLPASQTMRDITIRPYRPADHNACRHLWAELTEHRASLFGEPLAGESDAGAGFEEYLTQLTLSGMWVADHVETGVVGFIGLRLDGRTGDIDPVVVTATMRGHGIGRALLTKVAEEARRRGLARLTVSPLARDISALRTLHTVGFSSAATVTLTYDLAGPRTGRPSGREATLDLYDLRFDV